MQAIRTRYIGPTNTRSSRIQATCESKTIYVEYESGLDSTENHKQAMLALVANRGWNTDFYADMVGGQFKNDYYWVFDEKRLKALKTLVNSIRSGAMHGNPWCNKEFIKAVEIIGVAYGYYGNAADAPTTEPAITAWLNKGNK